MDESSGQPRQQTEAVAYAGAGGRLPPSRVANFAFVCGLISISALLAVWFVPLNWIGARIALFAGGIICGFAAVVGGIVGLRVARKRGGAGKTESQVGLIVGGITIALVVLLLLVVQAITRTYSNVERIKCRSNLRAIGQAMLLYANDNRGQFPQRFGQLVTHADVAPEVFICPASNDHPAAGPTTQQTLADFATPGHCSYIYLGAGMSMPSVPKGFVLAYEPLDNHEKEGAHFIFGDASVEWFDAKDAQKLIDQLKSGVNPPKR